MVQTATTTWAIDPEDPMAFEYMCRKTFYVESMTSHANRLTVQTLRVLEQTGWLEWRVSGSYKRWGWKEEEITVMKGLVSLDKVF